MSSDRLTAFADAVLQQILDAGSTILEDNLVVSLPAYLDAAEVRLLQMEVNRWSVTHIQLQHRPGERRVEVRLVASRPRR
jgi:hypothetical protein